MINTPKTLLGIADGHVSPWQNYVPLLSWDDPGFAAMDYLADFIEPPVGIGY